MQLGIKTNSEKENQSPAGLLLSVIEGIVSFFYTLPTASNTQSVDIKALVLNRIPAWQSCLIFQAEAFCTEFRNCQQGHDNNVIGGVRLGLAGDPLAGLGKLKHCPRGKRRWTRARGQGPGARGRGRCIRRRVTQGACGGAVESERSLDGRPLWHLGARVSLVSRTSQETLECSWMRSASLMDNFMLPLLPNSASGAPLTDCNRGAGTQGSCREEEREGPQGHWSATPLEGQGWAEHST